MRIRSRIPVVLLATGALAAATTACSGSGGGGTGLERALSYVPASAAGQDVEFSDVPTERKLVAKDRKLYANLDTYGMAESLSGMYTGPMEQMWGFDSADVKTVTTVGSAINSSRMTGTFDLGKINAAMKKAGYSGATSHGVLTMAKAGSGTMLADTSTRVVHNAGSPFTGFGRPGKSLRGVREYSAVAGCLGDVYEADFYPEDHGDTKHPDTVLMGMGARLTGGVSKETMCLVTKSDASAQAAADTLRDKRMKPGMPYADAKLTVHKGSTPWVSLTWTNADKPGLHPSDNTRDLDLPRLFLI